MRKHVYRVAVAFRSVGPAGVKDFAVGDEITLDRPAKPGFHLELARTEGEPVKAQEAPAAEAVAPKGKKAKS